VGEIDRKQLPCPEVITIGKAPGTITIAVI
jgi:hypothetical protein